MNDGGHRLGLMRLCVMVPWKRFIRHIRFIPLLDLCVPLTPNLYAHPQIWWLVGMETGVGPKCPVFLGYLFVYDVSCQWFTSSSQQISVTLTQVSASTGHRQAQPLQKNTQIITDRQSYDLTAFPFSLSGSFWYCFSAPLLLFSVSGSCDNEDTVFRQHRCSHLLFYFSNAPSYTSMNIFFSSSYAHQSIVCQVIYSFRFNMSLIFFDSEYVEGEERTGACVCVFLVGVVEEGEIGRTLNERFVLENDDCIQLCENSSCPWVRSERTRQGARASVCVW